MVNTRKLVAFALLMESGEGVSQKAPSYIQEKWAEVMECPIEYLASLLDTENRAKYLRYVEKWQ